MAGIQPGQPTQVPIEYTRGTGAFFPEATSNAVVNTDVLAGTATAGSAVSVTPGPNPSDQIVNVQVAADVATAFPSNPIEGQMVYRRDLGHLYVYVKETNTWNVV